MAVAGGTGKNKGGEERLYCKGRVASVHEDVVDEGGEDAGGEDVPGAGSASTVAAKEGGR